jgi:hypothetical protein
MLMGYSPLRFKNYFCLVWPSLSDFRAALRLQRAEITRSASGTHAADIGDYWVGRLQTGKCRLGFGD